MFGGGADDGDSEGLREERVALRFGSAKDCHTWRDQPSIVGQWVEVSAPHPLQERPQIGPSSEALLLCGGAAPNTAARTGGARHVEHADVREPPEQQMPGDPQCVPVNHHNGRRPGARREH